MKHVSHEAWRTADKVAPNGESRPEGPDKWQLLNAATEAREALGLSHRTLGVLRALLSFLPTREIGPDAVVYPSNKTLSARLGGMPESTLRRHLAELAAAGLLRRQDSPNRKRYARRVGPGVALAFGLDLTPMAEGREALSALAEDAKRETEALAVLRDEVALLRLRLGDLTSELADETRRALRRKPNRPTLEGLRDRLTQALGTTSSEPADLSDDDAQTERHIQRTEENFVKLPGIEDILSTCHEYRAYFPEKVRHWQDLSAIAKRLAPMMGVADWLWSEATRVMGARVTTTIVISMLERSGEIQCPAAYLKRLTQLAEAGDLRRNHLLPRRKLSADNPRTCLETSG